MTWRRMRNVAFTVLGGGIIFQTTGCETLVTSAATNIVTSYISSYVTELLLSGLAT
jgi:hypothetical protein